MPLSPTEFPGHTVDRAGTRCLIRDEEGSVVIGLPIDFPEAELPQLLRTIKGAFERGRCFGRAQLQGELRGLLNVDERKDDEE